MYARRPPASYWIVAILLTLWGLIGCFACLQQIRLGAEAMGPATDYDRQLFAALPGWYNWVYAVAVGSGLFGALALLGRSAVARPLFGVSLAAIVVQFGYIFLATDLIAHKGAAATVPFPVVIAAVAGFALWFASRAGRRGWLTRS